MAAILVFGFSAAASSRTAGSVRNGLIAYGSNSQIYVVNPNGSGRHQLTAPAEGTDYFNAWPAWSADGRKLAFVSEETRGISIVNPDGTDLQHLTDNRGAEIHDGNPTWSPEGRIAFIRVGLSRPLTVMTMNGDGSDLRSLPSNSYAEWELAWSPDGRFFAFADRRSIYVMRADGSKVKRLTKLRRGDPMLPNSDTEPAWSPDSRRIVFTRIMRPHGRYCDRLMVIRRDGTGLHQLRRDCPLPDSEPVWAPDGKKILFASEQLMTIRANGTHRRPLRYWVGGNNPAWQPKPVSP